MLVSSYAFCEGFYTIDTYGTFSTDLLDDDWFEESEFDHKQFVEDLAELHAGVINDALPAGGIKSVRVLSTTSPSYYNFSTDKVELEIDVDVFELHRYLAMHNNEKEFEKFIKEQFTSYDGFTSFTPNNLKDWYDAMEMNGEYDEIDRDKCVAFLAAWYLSREALTEDEYLDEMYDKVHEVMWNNFEQFTTETWREFTKYEDEFNRLKETQLEFEGFPPGQMYPMEITEWFKEVKLKETENADSIG